MAASAVCKVSGCGNDVFGVDVPTPICGPCWRYAKRKLGPGVHQFPTIAAVLGVELAPTKAPRTGSCAGFNHREYVVTPWRKPKPCR